MAAAVRGGDVDGVVFHTDKGGEYGGDLFARACTALKVTQSMGPVGSALDNAAAESFESTLEWGPLSRRHFATKAQARREVARFVDAYNHRDRLPEPSHHCGKQALCPQQRDERVDVATLEGVDVALRLRSLVVVDRI